MDLPATGNNLQSSSEEKGMDEMPVTRLLLKHRISEKRCRRTFGMLQISACDTHKTVPPYESRNHGVRVKACAILLNMVIKDERDPDALNFGTSAQDNATSSRTVVVAPDPSTNSAFASFISRYKAFRSSELPCPLRNDLVKHLWARSGN
uniref:AlNc14C14G1631 protein n=1 Tax=Albugo laibachii Nc14 TaxID=890382 RepID=F0W3P4_9STRA|nr:AlNc14C14G1631 [Albugo laibachii Nc14]|eukprot:CCA15714.1 AlNc14C14G1631 [Albugo laibachii Nc14]